MHESIIHLASMDDLTQIVQVKTDTWPQDEANAGLIRAAITHRDHQLLVAEIQGRIVGFVDGFMTHTFAGDPRWEVDLLAVSSAFRGHGIGKRLVEASTQVGRDRGAQLCRALIQIQNQASQQVFAHSHYVKSLTDVDIFVASTSLPEKPEETTGHWPAVYTCNYQGIWIEEQFNTETLNFGRWLIGNKQVELAGALIPVNHQEGQNAAARSGYESVGQYGVWTLDFTAAAG